MIARQPAIPRNVAAGKGTSARSSSRMLSALELSEPPSPHLWVSSQVQHGNHSDHLFRCREVDGIRERVQQRSTNVAGYRRELEWSLANARQRSIDIAEEPLAEPGSLVVVPARSILQIGLSERPNDKAAGHSRSVAAVEFCAEAFLNNLPAVTGVRIGFEILQALVEDFAVPIGNRNGLGSGGDSVPQ